MVRYITKVLKGKTYLMGKAADDLPDTYYTNKGFGIFESTNDIGNNFLDKVHGYHLNPCWRVIDGSIVKDVLGFSSRDVDDRDLERTCKRILRWLPKLLYQFAEDGDLAKFRAAIRIMAAEVTRKYQNERSEVVESTDDDGDRAPLEAARSAYLARVETTAATKTIHSGIAPKYLTRREIRKWLRDRGENV